MPRPQKERIIRYVPPVFYFKPAGIPLRELEEVILHFDELESLRLVEWQGKSQIEAAKKMGVSRVTLQRILHSAHKKIAESILFGKALRVEGGKIKILSNKNLKQIKEDPKQNLG